MLVTQTKLQLADRPVEIAAHREQVLIEAQSALAPVTRFHVQAHPDERMPIIMRHEIVKTQALSLGGSRSGARAKGGPLLAQIHPETGLPGKIPRVIFREIVTLGIEEG